ncbi:hypothetical protein [Thermoleptolyngbya sp.]
MALPLPLTQRAERIAKNQIEPPDGVTRTRAIAHFAQPTALWQI